MPFRQGPEGSLQNRLQVEVENGQEHPQVGIQHESAHYTRCQQYRPELVRSDVMQVERSGDSRLPRPADSTARPKPRVWW